MHKFKHMRTHTHTMQPHFRLSRFGVMTMLQRNAHIYQACAFVLDLKSEPVAVPTGLAQLFPGEAIASHDAIIQYTAIGDLLRLVFFDPFGYLDRPGKAEKRVGALFRPKFEKITAQLNERLWASGLTTHEALAAFEHYLVKIDRLLANARLLSSCRRPIHFDTAEWPLELPEVSQELRDELSGTCEAFNRAQVECHREEEQTEQQQTEPKDAATKDAQVDHSGEVVEAKEGEDDLDPATEIAYVAAKLVE